MIYLSENISSALFGIMLVICILWVIYEVMKDGSRKETKEDS